MHDLFQTVRKRGIDVACMYANGRSGSVPSHFLVSESLHTSSILPLYYLFCYSSLPFFFRALASVLRPLRPHQLSAALHGDADEGEVKVL